MGGRVEEAGLGRVRQFQHDRRAGPGVERRERFLEQQSVRGVALGALDIHLGLNDRDKAVRRDARGFGELLFDDRLDPCGVGEIDDARSEEHTSELQSLMRLSYAVFRLKKKKT